MLPGCLGQGQRKTQGRRLDAGLFEQNMHGLHARCRGGRSRDGDGSDGGRVEPGEVSQRLGLDAGGSPFARRHMHGAGSVADAPGRA